MTPLLFELPPPYCHRSEMHDTSRKGIGSFILIYDDLERTLQCDFHATVRSKCHNWRRCTDRLGERSRYLQAMSGPLKATKAREITENIAVKRDSGLHVSLLLLLSIQMNEGRRRSRPDEFLERRNCGRWAARATQTSSCDVPLHDQGSCCHAPPASPRLRTALSLSEFVAMGVQNPLPLSLWTRVLDVVS